MIEPTPMNQPDEAFFRMAKRDEIDEVFYIQTEREGLIIVNFMDMTRSKIGHHHNIFATVSHANKTYYWFDGKEIFAKDEFIDLMMQNYPDHFEWYLFHPELLG